MITHTVPTVSIFQTSNYQNFSFINGNRPLNQKKIANIIKEIEAGNDMLQYYPILVSVIDGKLQILDGQHRFFISKKLQRPVYYILASDEKTMQEIAKINSNVEKWKPHNFINCYVQQGNENYIKLQQFIDTYGINTGTSIRLLANGTPGVEGSSDALTKSFEHGTFEASHWDEAATIAEKCKLFSTAGFYKDRSFVIAIYRIYKANLIKVEELAAAFNKFPGAVEKQMTHKLYTQALELVYNKNKQKRTVII